jgi:hypothetical protein
MVLEVLRVEDEVRSGRRVSISIRLGWEVLARGPAVGPGHTAFAPPRPTVRVVGCALRAGWPVTQMAEEVLGDPFEIRRPRREGAHSLDRALLVDEVALVEGEEDCTRHATHRKAQPLT